MKITLATKITIARIVLIVPTVIIFIVGELLPHGSKEYLATLIVAAILFGLCCSTDFVDGHVARRTGTVSDLGKFLDPLADKVVIVIMLFLIVLFQDGLTLGGVYMYNALVIALLGGLILSRELLIGVFRSIAARKNIVLAADFFGKVKTVFLDVAVNALMLAGLHPAIGWIGTVLLYIGAALALFSGAHYIYKNKQVLEQSDEKDEPQDNNVGASAEAAEK